MIGGLCTLLVSWGMKGGIEVSQAGGGTRSKCECQTDIIEQLMSLRDQVYIDVARRLSSADEKESLGGELSEFV